MSRSRTGEILSDDGIPLFWRAWETAGEPLSRVVMLHGAGEHGGRYASLAEDLVEAGISCYALDQRGHGRSGGPRLHVDVWARYEDDARLFIDQVVTPASGASTIVYGHSMGSLVCLTLALAGDAARIEGFGGWILSGAGVRPTGVAKPHLVLIARLLSRVTPMLRLDLGIAAESLSHVPEIVEAYREDPLVVGRATVRWGSEALEALASIVAEADRIEDPMLILHGGQDPLAEAAGSRWLAETVRGEAELIIYEGALHEPHHEPAFGDVAGDIARWVRRRVT